MNIEVMVQNKPKILVTGAESTATRMMCRMVAEAGGEPIHAVLPKSRDKTRFPDGEWHLLVRDSKPDAAVVMFRDLMPTITSQTERHVESEEKAWQNLRQAYVTIMEQLPAAIPWFPVTFESLARPEAVTYLMKQLGLPCLPEEQWQDANAKYYGGDYFQNLLPPPLGSQPLPTKIKPAKPQDLPEPVVTVMWETFPEAERPEGWDMP
jgi:hypothetical protein